MKEKKNAWINIGWSALFGSLRNFDALTQFIIISIFLSIVIGIVLIPWRIFVYLMGMPNWNSIYFAILAFTGLFVGLIVMLRISYYLYIKNLI